MVKFILEVSIGEGGNIGDINSYYYIGHRQIPAPPPPPRSLIYGNDYKTNYI